MMKIPNAQPSQANPNQTSPVLLPVTLFFRKCLSVRQPNPSL